MMLIKSKKQKRKQADITASKFPDPNYFLDPKNEVNVGRLIRQTRKTKDFKEGKILNIFKDLHKNAGFGHRNDAQEMIRLVTKKLSDYFQFSHENCAEAESIYLAWNRISESYGDEYAAQNILRVALYNQVNNELIVHWANSLVDILISNLSFGMRYKTDDYITNKLNDLIRQLAPSHPDLALNFSFKLIAICDKSNRHDEILKAAKEFSKVALNKMSGKRILALESIEKTEDRSTKATCERFESLTQIPVKLAKINDTSILKQTLDNEFPWFSEITEKLIKNLLIRQLGTGAFYLPPMVILGPPGIGKTSYVNRLSQLVNVPFRVMNMAGKNDNRDLVGTARGWGTGHPSMPITLINEYQIGNPIVILDELDKCGGSDNNGRALDSLLPLLEPSSASRVYDEFLCGHANFSFVSWIGTANNIKQLPTTLLSRLDVVTASSPMTEHYPAIIRSSVHSFCSMNGIHPSQIPPITEADWRWLNKYYKSPRIAKKATEKWLTYHLLNTHNRLN
jgi:ATP-dependent Lon protease